MTHQNNENDLQLSANEIDQDGWNVYEDDPIYLHERVSALNPLYLEATSEENLCKDIIKIIKKYCKEISNYWNREFHRLDTCEYSLCKSEFKRANKTIITSEMDAYDVEAARILSEWFRMELSTCDYESDNPKMYCCITCNLMDSETIFGRCPDCVRFLGDYDYEPRFRMPDME